MLITAAKLFYYQLPFANALTFNGQQSAVRDGLILQLQDSHNRLSYGEIAPLPGFSKETLTQAKQQILTLLDNDLNHLAVQQPLFPSVRFALDSALQQLPVSQSAPPLDSVPLFQGSNKTLLEQYIRAQSPTLIKLKVGRQEVAQDIRLVQQLVALNHQLQLRCDANQQWSSAQAALFFANIPRNCLDYIEEPTPSHQHNLQLAQRYQIALGLDETLQDSDFHYQDHPAIKALVIKPTLIGSLAKVAKLIEIAAQQQLQVHISSSFESIIGLQQLTALAQRYQQKCALTLGIDTLKYFNSPLLIAPQQIVSDLQKLECLWHSN